MDIALVVGSAVSTIKDDGLHGRKLLIVAATDTSGEPTGQVYVAVDAIGAGEGELVLVARGSAGRYTGLTTDAPVDAAIVAILDSLETSGRTSFRKS